MLGAVGLLWSVVTSLRSAGVRSVSNIITVLLYSGLALTFFTLSLPSYSGQLDRATYDKIPREVKNWDRKLSHLELHHGYGLFRWSYTMITITPDSIGHGTVSRLCNYQLPLSLKKTTFLPLLSIVPSHMDCTA